MMQQANHSPEPTHAFGALLYRQSVSAMIVIGTAGSANPGAGG